jgi:NtrC-family two-component system sensor histidine kinase KinB
MEDEGKTSTQLSEELATLRQRVAELKTRESAHQQAEEELRQSEERYRGLIESSGDAIYTLAPDGMITFLNPAFETATGWSCAEWLGKSFAPILHPDDLPVALETFQRVLQGAIPPLVELRVLSRSGEYLIGEFVATPQLQGGKVVGALGIARNITARKALERQRAEFLTMLAHDIKSPLGNILGYISLLLDQVKERTTTEGEEEEILLRLQSNAVTVHSLVTNYLELSRIEAGRLTLGKQPLVVNDLLRRVGKQYEGESQRRRITLEFHLQEELPPIEGDALALERIFANLLHNAIKFTPELGRITVSSARQRDEMVVVAVADTGPGLAAEEVATIFEKYRQATSPNLQEGTGLGLSIVKALAEAHGGWVEVSSTPGQGTSFMVFLPGSRQAL